MPLGVLESTNNLRTLAKPQLLSFPGIQFSNIQSVDNCFSLLLLFLKAFKEIQSKEEKMRAIASKWKELSEEDRRKWQEEAKKVGKADPKTMSNKERLKIIRKETSNLMKQVRNVHLHVI